VPVVTTDVGGNAEVVAAPELGILIPFGDARVLEDAIHAALARRWDREALCAHAARNAWDTRVEALVEEFRRLAPPPAPPTPPALRARRPEGV
jgi:glycosyltransferase involved in cell wall biosynthesis